jgi:cytochrome c-type biogenesis protein CcmE
VIALAIASILAVFLLYTSLAGGGTPSLRPSQLPGHTGNVSLAGIVLAPVTGDAHAGGLHFRLKDFDGPTKVAVAYTGTVPDLFKAGRHIVVTGRLRDGTFVADPSSMITKCPSKYAPAKKQS